MKSCMDLYGSPGIHSTLNAPFDYWYDFELASSANVMLFRGGVGYDLTS